MAAYNTSEGLLDVSIMNAEHMNSNFSDVAVMLSNRYLPMEVITRLKSLWETTKVVAGEVIQVGRIIIMKILAFIAKYPNMAIGFAIGAAIGALTGMIPFIGVLLQPIVAVLAVASGVIIGAQMDRGLDAGVTMDGAISAAKAFFELFAEIFMSLKEHWKSA